MIAILANSKIEEESKEETSLTILGLSLKQFLTWLGIAIFSLFLLIKLVQRVFRYYRRRKSAYLISEKYYFDAFLKSIGTRSAKQVLPILYRWIDELPLKNPTLKALDEFCNNTKLKLEIKSIIQTNSSNNLNLKKSVWIQIRKQVLTNTEGVNSNSIQNWINP